MRHGEVALELLLGVAPALVADRHDGVVIETGPATDDRRVVTEGTITMKLDDVGEGESDVVGGEGTPRIARHLHSLERSEVLVNLFSQIRELPLEWLDRFGHAELAVTRRLLDLVDLPFQLGDRLLEFKLCR